MKLISAEMIAVIADDITGAAEIAGVGMRYGLTVAFCLGRAAPPTADADIAVMATDTRAMSRAKAVKETRRLVAGLKQAGMVNIFKKTDSALRGHIMAELKATLEVLGRTRALLVPANPAAGRVISEGCYTIGGISLDKTSFAADPGFPARSSAVEDLLGPFGELHSGRATGLKKGITLPDTVVAGDLDRYCGWLESGSLPAGSAAFFEAFLRAERGLEEAGPVPSPGRERPCGKTLMVCGSTHKQSRAFVRKAKERPSVLVAEMPQGLLQKDPDPGEILAWEKEIVHRFTQSDTIVLSPGQYTACFEGSDRVVRETLAKVAGHVQATCAVRHLLVEGGATTFSLVKEMGITSLAPVSELGKGVVKMKVPGRAELFMTIKPGSYPWPEGLLDTGTKPDIKQ